jgi:hypothetical protein
LGLGGNGSLLPKHCFVGATLIGAAEVFATGATGFATDRYNFFNMLFAMRIRMASSANYPFQFIEAYWLAAGSRKTKSLAKRGFSFSNVGQRSDLSRALNPSRTICVARPPERL